LKRKILFAILIIGLAAMVQAQVWGPGRNQRNLPAVETVTVSGTMVVAQGRPALKSGDITYFVSGISQLIGFIDGLKEGAQVTFEGVATTSPSDNSIKFLSPSKLTINGKVYELASPASPSSPSSPPALPELPSNPVNPGTPRLYQYRLPERSMPMAPPNTTPRRR